MAGVYFHEYTSIKSRNILICCSIPNVSQIWMPNWVKKKRHKNFHAGFDSRFKTEPKMCIFLWFQNIYKPGQHPSHPLQTFKRTERQTEAYILNLTYQGRWWFFFWNMKTLLWSPSNTFQHLNLLTFYKEKKVLGDVFMTPDSSVTGFKELLFVCVLLC